MTGKIFCVMANHALPAFILFYDPYITKRRKQNGQNCKLLY